MTATTRDLQCWSSIAADYSRGSVNCMAAYRANKATNHRRLAVQYLRMARGFRSIVLSMARRVEAAL